MSCPYSRHNKTLMLIFHILFSLLFLYVAWAIITKNYPEEWVGYTLLATVLLMIGAHVYCYNCMRCRCNYNCNCNKSNQEQFCNWYGPQTRTNCPDKDELDELYRKGILTEYTDLTKFQGDLSYLK